MINYIVYEISTGEIKICGTTKELNFNLLGGNGLDVILAVGSPKTHWVNNGVLQEYTIEQKQKKSNQSNPFSIWSNKIFDWVETRSSQEIYQSTANSVRTQRNTFLQESDWTDTASAPARLGQELYDQWQIYRQALRDITTQPDYPLDVSWPIPPT